MTSGQAQFEKLPYCHQEPKASAAAGDRCNAAKTTFMRCQLSPWRQTEE
jgi:hypothetical protein